MEEIIV